jgi:hypothetical protein
MLTSEQYGRVAQAVREDPRRWIEGCVRVIGKGGGVVSFQFNRAQCAVHDAVQGQYRRGEPNGPLPPDRYRLRLWFLDGADPASPEVIAFRTAVGCTHAGEEAVNAIAPDPDIDDGGDLRRGNHQIRPQLKRTCTP